MESKTALKAQLLQETISNSPEETAALATEFGATLKPGDTLAFYGNLGTGKTFFIQQLCRFFATEEDPSSPTFTIVNEYHAANRLYIYHFDFYRLEHNAELANLGLEDYFFSDNLCFIEWADKIQDFLPPQRYEIHLDLIDGEPQSRNIRILKLNE